MNVTIGARVVKTGIAVALALFITHHLAGFAGSTIAGVAAIFAIQPSVYRSWQHMLEQVQTNTLGAVIALIVSMIVPVNEIVVGLTCIVIIIVTLAIRMESTVTLPLVTCIVVLEAGGEWLYALERFATILIGIGAAFIVNAIVMPPNHMKQFQDTYRQALGIMSLLIRTSISDELKETEARQQRDQLNKLVRKLNEQYGMLEEEWKKWKRFRPLPGRHLVVYKQMVHAMTLGQFVLDTVETHYFPQRKDDSSDRLLDRMLEELMHYHEHTMLKYEGKVKRGEQLHDMAGVHTESMLRLAVHQVRDGEQNGLSLVVVISSIYEYARQLQRLDRRIEHVRNGKQGQGKEALAK